MKKLTADDPDTRSVDVVLGNIEQLRALFPDAFAEGNIDFDVLKQLLGGAVDEREEKYGLNWHGKRRARQLALAPSNGTLRPSPEGSVDWDTTQNLVIEGDNLEVLKLLQKSYSGKVKLIYIDPPYNTGKDFVYPDNYQDNVKNYLELTGQVEGAAKISSNTETNGRFHTDWLNMMYPRLKLARALLAEDGVIFVSIDDNEVTSLKTILSEIFGEENFVAQIVVQTNPRGRSLDRFVAKTFEYVLIFARDASTDAIGHVPKSDEAIAEYSKDDADGRYRELELRNRNPVFNRSNRPNLWYPLYIDPAVGGVSLVRDSAHSVEAWPRNSEGVDGCWTWGRPKVQDEGRVLVGRQAGTGAWRVYRKDYLPQEGASTKEKSLWVESNLNHENGKEEIRRLFAGTPFDFPKSVGLVQKVVRLGSSGDGIVLDFFAGSGTTGQAVMAQNALDGGRRRYILVQLPERLDSGNKDQRVAAEFCEKLNIPNTIAELTKERLRRAAKKVKDENPMFVGDLGFRVFKLDASNIRAWEPERQDLAKSLFESVEHLKSDRTEADILYELLLKLGLDLCVPIETKEISRKEVHSIGGGVLLACLADKITRAEVEPLAAGIVKWHQSLAPAGDTRCVFRDSAFADDVAKANLAAILNQHGLANVRSL